MFGRRFGRGAPANDEYRDGGNVATAERDQQTTRMNEDRDGDGVRDGNGNGNGYAGGNGGGTAVAAPPRRRGVARTAGDAVVLDREARLRQRDRFGGLNWGAAFFGWLVAIGMAVILTAIVSAAGAAIGLSNNPSKGDAGTIGIVGGALLIAIAVIAYYCGGYVAGRMSRFDGARQGFGTWAFGLIMTLLIAAAGAIFGSQYNVFESLNLPRIPVSTSDLATGGAIALAAIFFGSLIAAILGGKAGERYHRRVDRAALTEPV